MLIPIILSKRAIRSANIGLRMIPFVIDYFSLTEENILKLYY